jgi:hypothetical protein
MSLCRTLYSPPPRTGPPRRLSALQRSRVVQLSAVCATPSASGNQLSVAQASHQIANAGTHSKHCWCAVVCVNMSPGLQKQTKITHVQQTQRSGVRCGLQVHRITGKTARLAVSVWRAGNYEVFVRDVSPCAMCAKIERHLKVEPQVH